MQGTTNKKSINDSKTIINLFNCHINERESGHCGYCHGRKGD